MTPLVASVSVHPLATTNAVLNSLATILLLAGWVIIKRGNIPVVAIVPMADYELESLSPSQKARIRS